MRMVAGALLVLTAELAYAHAHQIGFPHQVAVRSVLLPLSLVCGVAGVVLLGWGLWRDQQGMSQT